MFKMRSLQARLTTPFAFIAAIVIIVGLISWDASNRLGEHIRDTFKQCIT